MKKFFSILIFLALLFPSDSKSEIEYFPLYSPCTTIDQLSQIIQIQEQVVVFYGDSVRLLNGEKNPTKLNFIMFFNEKNKTYTIVERINESMICIISFGNVYEFIVPGLKVKKSLDIN